MTGLIWLSVVMGLCEEMRIQREDTVSLMRQLNADQLPHNKQTSYRTAIKTYNRKKLPNQLINSDYAD